MTEAQRLWEMDLHETYWPRSATGTRIMRVCGGWIYTQQGCDSVFVPLDNEFISKENK